MEDRKPWWTFLVRTGHLNACSPTCTRTALFRPATIALHTIQAHWDSFRPSLGPLRFHLSTHYPLSCWLNNTGRKERKGEKVYPSGGSELPELLQAIIRGSEKTTRDSSFTINREGFKETQSAGYGYVNHRRTIMWVLQKCYIRAYSTGNTI